MLRIVPNRTIYIQPYERLISAHTSDISAKVRVTGSPAASGIWKVVRIALVHTSLTAIHPNSKETTHEASSADTRFSVFHSRKSESMNASHECLNRISAGETTGGAHSSGKGNGKCIRVAAGATLACAATPRPATAPVALAVRAAPPEVLIMR